MCKPTALSPYRRAFFSLDAALALTIAISSMVLFYLLLSSAENAAQSQAKERSGSLLALRLSSRLLELSSYQPDPPGLYAKQWEIDLQRAQGVQLQPVLASTGRQFLSFSLSSPQGELLNKEEGQRADETYCASRLALCEGEPCRLQACVS